MAKAVRSDDLRNGCQNRSVGQLRSVSYFLPLLQVIHFLCFPPFIPPLPSLRPFLLYRESWKVKFHPRDLFSLSAEPFLLYPTHYTGEPNYISDTEDSVALDSEKTVAEESTELTDKIKEESTLLGEGTSTEDANLFMNSFKKKDEL